MGCGALMKRLLGLLAVGAAMLAVGGCLSRNQTPIASFTRSPASGVAPLAVFFDASASEDADGVLVGYAWDFGDGAQAEGITATHTFAAPATYTVTLRVTDDDGGTGETTRAVDVASSDALPPEGTELGERAPGFTLADVRTGNPRSLEDFRGSVVLLEFWRSTCSSCRSSMPGVEALRTRFADQGVVVVLVSQDTSAEEARALLDGQGYHDFIGLFDAGASVRARYDVELVPRMYVLDRQGIVRHVDHPVRIRDRHITPWL